MDYGLVLISHSTDKTFTDENGAEYNKIVPTLDKRATKVVSRMADIIGYSREVTDEDGDSSVKLFMRGTPRYMAGSRFKYTPDYIDFNYTNLVNAIADAIDTQMKEDGEIVKATIANQIIVPDGPSTSKNDFPYLEIMSLIITGLGVGFLVYAKRKKK